MKTTTLNSEQALYDAQTPPDDAEYERKKEEFLQQKEAYKNILNIPLTIDAFIKAIEKEEEGISLNMIERYGDLVEDAIEWQSTRLAAKETGFKL